MISFIIEMAAFSDSFNHHVHIEDTKKGKYQSDNHVVMRLSLASTRVHKKTN